MMPRYYHFTLAQNINTIFRRGLIPKFRNGLGRQAKMSVVYLTTDPNYILSVAINPKRYVRLEIDVRGLQINPEHDWSKIYIHPSYYPKHTTFICTSTIQPERIKVC